MSENEQSRSDEQTNVRHALKRRGILAAAGAVVAGMAMRQASERVGANVATWTMPYDSGDVANLGYLIRVRNTEGGFGSGGLNGITTTDGGSGVNGSSESTTDGAGVRGDNRAPGDTTSSTSAGVVGYTSHSMGYGVWGYGGSIGIKGKGTDTGVEGNGGDDRSVNTTGFPVGVRGSVLDTGFGVYGNAGNGSGIYGVCTGGYGVGGIAGSGTGVHGQSTSGTAISGLIPSGNASGTIAISGTNNSSAANSHGIVGTAGSGHGLIGNTNFTGGGPPYYGGLVGNAPNGAYAGLFFGKVSITGTLNGHTAIMQQAQIAVAHPDGTHRLANSIGAVDAWLEDFGEGTLTHGQANVTIAPDFAAVADMSKYHVFLTAHGNYHLHVAEMKADGFVVGVTDGGGSTPPTGGAPVPGSQVAKASNVTGTFSWRMAAKRKDGQTARLAAYTFPKLEAPAIPASPQPAVPVKKP